MARASARASKTEWLLQHSTAARSESDGEEEEESEEEEEEEESDEEEFAPVLPATSPDSQQGEDSEDEAPAPRAWRGVSAAHKVPLHDAKSLSKFTFGRAVADEFWRSTFPAFLHQRQEHNEPTTSRDITVYESVRITVEVSETMQQEHRQLRCSRSFMGEPWQDGVVVIEGEEDPGKLLPQRNRVLTQSNIEIARTPNGTRKFGLLQLIFEYEGELLLLIETLEGANVTKDKRRKKRMQVKWQNPIIPNWHHLRTMTTKKSNHPAALSRRLDVFPADCMERVVVVTPDPNQPSHEALRYYWSPRNEDCVLSDMIFHTGVQYEQHGQTDPATGHPLVAFEDAVSVQPWDLVPPSSFASESRSSVTMEDDDFARATNSLAEADRPYAHDDGGSDQNSEDDSEDGH
jgi:hypothetical protein